ncbi:unnamed protein product, partial [Didymodactylos carnosus]
SPTSTAPTRRRPSTLDLQRWALKAAKELHMEAFHAAHGWVNNFKARYHVISRRVTNIVTRHKIENPDEILKAENDFLDSFYKSSSRFSPSEILNTDQVGVERELYSKRTLSAEGEKKVFGTVRFKNAMPHSYTSQPTISLEGKLVGPMYLCLQEPKDKMGELVKRGLFEPENVVITCSSSGKLTSSLVRYWRDNCLLPFVGNKCLLLSDSWPGQSGEDLYSEEGCDGKKLQRLEIPPKTTSDLQPLDCYTNPQIKNFIKKCYQRVALDELDVD